MKLACLIDRPTQYRLLGPVIDAALHRGWDVECWHDERRTGHFLKSGSGDAAAGPPRFAYGSPTVLPYRSDADLDARLRGATDAVVSIGTEPYYFRGGRSGPRPVWAWVQYVSDFIHHLGPDDLLACDIAAFHSPWWIDWTVESFAVEGKLPDRSAFEQGIRSRAITTGVPELDATPGIDAAEVRRRWNIPPDRPVVVLLPFPQGVGKAAFWPRHIFNQPNRLRQAFDVVTRRRFEYWPDIVQGWNDASVVRAIRQFCDRNNAFLLVKSRPKTAIPGYLEAAADLAMYDDSHYPATILETLSVASLCISFYSSAVMEAVPMHVPHLCLAFDMTHYFDVDRVSQARALRLYNRNPGGLYQFAGATSTLSIPDAIRTLPESRLEDFALDPGARRAYVDTFLGPDDAQASARLLDAVSGMVAARRGEHPMTALRES